MPELRDVEVVAEGLLFPEGPVALGDGSVLVCEIRSGNVVRVTPGGGVEVFAAVGGGPNGAAMGPDGALYVCNNGGFADRRTAPSVQRVDLATRHVELLYSECDGVAIGSPNDLVFDETGGFYFTGHVQSGAIYYAQPDGSSVTMLAGDRPHPNGIGISPDGTLLYWAETHTRQVQRRRITAPGRIEASSGATVRSLFSPGGVDRFAVLAGLPGCHELDSLTIDSAGSILVGTLVDSGVSEISADGSWTLHTLPSHLADAAVTNVCFGGPDLDTLYITCSTTGRLLRARWHRPGLPQAFNA